MGLALYISLERLIPEGEANSISGKSLARAQDELKHRCDDLAVPELMRFYSEVPGSTAALLDGAGDVMARAMEDMQRIQQRLSKAPPPDHNASETLRAQLDAAADAARNAPQGPERWFPAAEGLKTIRALIDSLTAEIEAGRVVEFADPFVRIDAILADLREMERVLAAAEQAGVGFHMSFDFLTDIYGSRPCHSARPPAASSSPGRECSLMRSLPKPSVATCRRS